MQDPGKSRTNFTYLLLMKIFQQEEGEFREDKILQSWRMWLSGALGNYMKWPQAWPFPGILSTGWFPTATRQKTALNMAVVLLQVTPNLLQWPQCVVHAVCRAGEQLNAGTLIPSPRPSRDAHQSHLLQQKVAPSWDPEGEGGTGRPRTAAEKRTYMKYFLELPRSRKLCWRTCFHIAPQLRALAQPSHVWQPGASWQRWLPRPRHGVGGTPLHPPHLHPPGKGSEHAAPRCSPQHGRSQI